MQPIFPFSKQIEKLVEKIYSYMLPLSFSRILLSFPTNSTSNSVKKKTTTKRFVIFAAFFLYIFFAERTELALLIDNILLRRILKYEKHHTVFIFSIFQNKISVFFFCFFFLKFDSKHLLKLHVRHGKESAIKRGG